jgi:hypothetical protein
MKIFVYLKMLEGISDERKHIDQYQDFTLFLNMDLEMPCLFLFKSNDKLFERSEKLF